MNIFKIASKSCFISEVVNYVTHKFSDNLDKLKIILPSGYICFELQQAITSHLGTTLLPEVTPINDISTEGEEVFKIPSQQIEVIGGLEEKMILTEIIHAYNKINYTIGQSIKVSTGLANLFYELECNNISIDQLKDIPGVNQSHHWNIIYDFLVVAHTNWQEKITSLGKFSRAGYQKLMFNTEVMRLINNQDQAILIAGTVGNNLQTQEFIAAVARLQNGYVILPPTGEPSSRASKISTEEPLFNIHKLLSLLEINLGNIPMLGATQRNSLDKLINGDKANALVISGHAELVSASNSAAFEILNQVQDDNIPVSIKKISYIEFDNIFEEAEYISGITEDYILNNPNAKIAISVSNQNTKSIYCQFLSKLPSGYMDLVGTDLLTLNSVNFILSVADLLCSEFSVKKLFNMLGHQMIEFELATKLKNMLIKHNRFASNLEDIRNIINESNDLQLVKWTNHICDLLSTKPGSVKFDQILRYILIIAEKLSPDIWALVKDTKISDSFAEILRLNWYLTIGSLSDYPDILKELLMGARTYDSRIKSNIVLSSPRELKLINFDLMIIADFNEGSYITSSAGNPWANRHMQDELGLQAWQTRYSDSIYDLYLNLDNSEVIITRSKRHQAGSNLLPSHFLLRLEIILGNGLNKFIGINNYGKSGMVEANKAIFTAGDFPRQISATDIELLIRSPYNFYAKKILGLVPLKYPEESTNLAEFGNFFHQLVDEYTINYSSKEKNKQLVFTQLGQKILDSSIFPIHSRKTWRARMLAIADDFIEFDELRRKNISKIHTELKGSMFLDILDQKVEITAIADRIEINKQGRAIIMDFKTGAVPTKKDVLSGFSPQLIIEALIMLDNGFDIGANQVESLVYVKVGSSSPYLNTTELKLSSEELAHHKEGLVSLLEYYIKEPKFLPEQNLSKYDNYKHFARRVN